jgi:hypothetical protein
MQQLGHCGLQSISQCYVFSNDVAGCFDQARQHQHLVSEMPALAGLTPPQLGALGFVPALAV